MMNSQKHELSLRLLWINIKPEQFRLCRTSLVHR